MDCGKAGKLIFDLRKEKSMTQKQLANAMNISDKTISKWERGLGFPDVSLLPTLSKVLNVDVEKLLLGDLEPNSAEGGNMKKIKFYVCPACGNVLTATGEAGVTCCGRKLAPLVPKPADEAHRLAVDGVEDDVYITFAHEMSKAHYIGFVACVSFDRVLLVKLYPEQGGEVRFPGRIGKKIYSYCSQHGLWMHEIKK